MQVEACYSIEHVAIDTVQHKQSPVHNILIYDCAPDEQTSISILATSIDKHFESVSTHFPHFMPHGRSERMREANPLCLAGHEKNGRESQSLCSQSIWSDLPLKA